MEFEKDEPGSIPWEETVGWDDEMNIILNSPEYFSPAEFPLSNIRRFKEIAEKSGGTIELFRIGDDIHARAVYSRSSNEQLL